MQILFAMLARAVRISGYLFKFIGSSIVGLLHGIFYLLCGIAIMSFVTVGGEVLVCSISNNFAETLVCSHASQKCIISTENFSGDVVATQEYDLKKIVEPRIEKRVDSVSHAPVQYDLMATVDGKKIRIPTDRRPKNGQEWRIEDQRKALANFLKDPSSQDYQVKEYKGVLLPYLKPLRIEIREKLLLLKTGVSHFVRQRTKEVIFSAGLKEPSLKLMQSLREKNPKWVNQDTEDFVAILLLWCVCGYLWMAAAIVFEKAGYVFDDAAIKLKRFINEWARQGG